MWNDVGRGAALTKGFPVLGVMWEWLEEKQKGTIICLTGMKPLSTIFREVLGTSARCMRRKEEGGTQYAKKPDHPLPA